MLLPPTIGSDIGRPGLRRTVFVSTGNEGGAAGRLERWL